MTNSQLPNRTFSGYCDDVVANINSAFINHSSPCNNFFSVLLPDQKQCTLCEFDLNDSECAATKKLVYALKDYMQAQGNVFDWIFSGAPPEFDAGFLNFQSNKACHDELIEATCEVVFLSFDAKLMGRTRLEAWLNSFSEDLARNKYMDELDIYKNMAIQPALKELANFLNLENDLSNVG